VLFASTPSDSWSVLKHGYLCLFLCRLDLFPQFTLFSRRGAPFSLEDGVFPPFLFSPAVDQQLFSFLALLPALVSPAPLPQCLFCSVRLCSKSLLHTSLLVFPRPRTHALFLIFSLFLMGALSSSGLIFFYTLPRRFQVPHSRFFFSPLNERSCHLRPSLTFYFETRPV